MQFIVNWETLDHEQSIPLLLQGISLPAGLNVKSSWHVIGKPQGVMLIETAEPEKINTVLAALPKGVFEIDVHAVVEETAAKKAHSEHQK